MGVMKIKNLHIEVDEKKILKGLNLSIGEGELHVVMGRNGSGKSTLANTICGKDDYTISSGEIFYKENRINNWSPEKRSCEGIFMSFQYPVSLPGVNSTQFLKAALNSKNKYLGTDEVNAAEFIKIIKDKLAILDLDESFIRRAVNENLSGGEKKKMEILQMLVLEPQLSILDETDSGLDIDSLKIISEGINKYRDGKKSFLLITHYQRILDHIKPDFVHILMNGKIVKSGDIELSKKLERDGFGWLERETNKA